MTDCRLLSVQRVVISCVLLTYCVPTGNSMLHLCSVALLVCTRKSLSLIAHRYGLLRRCKIPCCPFFCLLPRIGIVFIAICHLLYDVSYCPLPTAYWCHLLLSPTAYCHRDEWCRQVESEAAVAQAREREFERQPQPSLSFRESERRQSINDTSSFSENLAVLPKMTMAIPMKAPPRPRQNKLDE